MTRELVDRMRTCAAAIEASKDSGNPWDLTLVGNDAARLLRIAADALDAQQGPPEPIGEPMALLEPQPAPRPPVTPQQVFAASLPATWGGDLPLPTEPAGGQPCPNCRSIDARTVRRVGRRLAITCPVCSNVWEYP